MQKLPFFPHPLPDETLYSVVGRFHLLSCFGEDHITSLRLFGNHKGGFLHDFPCGIDHLCEAVTPWHGQQIQLIQNLTLIPYFAAFLPRNTLDEAHDSMRKGNCGRIKFALGLTPSRVAGTHPLKACPACIQADTNVMSFPYWHRSHQLPGVLVCPEHGSPLVTLALKTNRLGKFRYLLPVDIPRRAQIQAAPENSVQTTRLLEIAKISQELLHSGLTSLDPKRVHQAYLFGLRERGWLKASGQIRQQAFRKDFLAYIAPLSGISEFTALVESVDKEAGFLSALVRKPRSQKHPLKHLLLIQRLFGGLAGFKNAYDETARPQADFTRTSLHSARPSRIDQDFTARMQALLVAESLSLRDAAPRLGISVSTLAVRAEQAGIPVQRRSKRITGTFLQEIRHALESGDTLVSIRQRLELSKASIYRLLQADSALREAWQQARFEQDRQSRRDALLAILAKNPHSGRNTIKKALGSGRYTWLWRNDKAWVESVLPSQVRHAHTSHKPAVNWATRDSLFATAIPKAVERLRNHPGKPVRVTRAAIFRLIPDLGRKAFNLAKMPITQALLARMVETTPMFQQRRMAWAQKELERTEGYAPEYRVLRLAGLNRKHKRKAA